MLKPFLSLRCRVRNLALLLSGDHVHVHRRFSPSIATSSAVSTPLRLASSVSHCTVAFLTPTATQSVHSDPVGRSIGKTLTSLAHAQPRSRTFTPSRRPYNRDDDWLENDEPTASPAPPVTPKRRDPTQPHRPIDSELGSQLHRKGIAPIQQLEPHTVNYSAAAAQIAQHRSAAALADNSIRPSAAVQSLPQPLPAAPLVLTPSTPSPPLLCPVPPPHFPLPPLPELPSAHHESDTASATRADSGCSSVGSLASSLSASVSSTPPTSEFDDSDQLLSSPSCATSSTFDSELAEEVDDYYLSILRQEHEQRQLDELLRSPQQIDSFDDAVALPVEQLKLSEAHTPTFPKYGFFQSPDQFQFAHESSTIAAFSVQSTVMDAAAHSAPQPPSFDVSAPSADIPVNTTPSTGLVLDDRAGKITPPPQPVRPQPAAPLLVPSSTTQQQPSMSSDAEQTDGMGYFEPSAWGAKLTAISSKRSLTGHTDAVSTIELACRIAPGIHVFLVRWSDGRISLEQSGGEQHSTDEPSFSSKHEPQISKAIRDFIGSDWSELRMLEVMIDMSTVISEVAQLLLTLPPEIESQSAKLPPKIYIISTNVGDVRWHTIVCRFVERAGKWTVHLRDYVETDGPRAALLTIPGLAMSHHPRNHPPPLFLPSAGEISKVDQTVLQFSAELSSSRLQHSVGSDALKIGSYWPFDHQLSADRYQPSSSTASSSYSTSALPMFDSTLRCFEHICNDVHLLGMWINVIERSAATIDQLNTEIAVDDPPFPKLVESDITSLSDHTPQHTLTPILTIISLATHRSSCLRLLCVYMLVSCGTSSVTCGREISRRRAQKSRLILT